MIIVTGAAGFIGSCLLSFLNKNGNKKIILVDNFSNEQKNKNLENKIYSEKIDRDIFFDWLNNFDGKIDSIYHIGARTDTSEFDISIFDKYNLNFSKLVWNYCTEKQVPLVYASSAATYGMGEIGYDDNHDIIEKLKPLNPYGESKNDFDKWVLKQKQSPPFWAGFKFFNVYGPNEYHKGRMASVVLHTFRKIKEKGKMELFRSHNPDFKDGEQLRDFIYVKDVVEVLYFIMNKKSDSAIYNLGTAKARSFYDLASAVFNSENKEINISFVDTPEDIRNNYQYYTKANMKKLRSIGCQKEFTSLEKGIEDYVKNYLTDGVYY